MYPQKLTTEEQRLQLADHLKRLSSDDRYLRFGNVVSDAFIDKYVERSYNDTNRWFGLIDDDHVVGAIHLARVTSKKIEMGLSLDMEYRGKGYGQLLFDRGFVWARANGANQIYVVCLTQNKAMQHIARKNNMLVATLCPEEREGKLEFVSADISAPFADMILERMAAVDAALMKQKKFINRIIKAWMGK